MTACLYQRSFSHWLYPRARRWTASHHRDARRGPSHLRPGRHRRTEPKGSAFPLAHHDAAQVDLVKARPAHVDDRIGHLHLVELGAAPVASQLPMTALLGWACTTVTSIDSTGMSTRVERTRAM